jgi:hypothetical protein
MFQGREGNAIENVRLRNCEFVVTSGKEIPNLEAHGAICGIFKEPIIRFVKGLQLDGVTFTTKE